MKKSIAISLIPAISFVAMGAIIALPVYAQATPVTECSVVQDVRISGITVKTGTVIQQGDDSIVVAETNQADLDLDIGGPGVTVPTSDWGSICFVDTVNKIVDWIFFILLTVAFAFIVLAAFMWVTSAGSPEKQQAAGKMIIAALVGIVIALFAKILPAIVLGIIT